MSEESILDKADLRSLLSIGKFLLNKKKFKQAEVIYNKCILQYPDDFRAYFNLGNILKSNNDNNEALDYYIKSLDKIKLSNSIIIDKDDTLSIIYGAISTIYIKLVDPIKSIEYCQQGIINNSNDSTCLYNLNISLRQLNRMDEAIQLSWESINLKPPNFNFFKENNNIDNIEKLNIEINKNNNKNDEEDKIIVYRISIYCIKWGTKYNSDYVNNLYNSITKYFSSNLQTENNSIVKYHKMICYTDNSDDINNEILCRSFHPETKIWKGWWLKASLFNDNEIVYNNIINDNNDNNQYIYKDWSLYFDLDTVICGSIDFLINNCIYYSSSNNNKLDFYTLGANHMKTEGRKCGLNSSIIIWENGNFNELFNFLLLNYEKMLKCIYKFDHYLEMMLTNSNNINIHYLQETCDNKIIDFSSIYKQDIDELNNKSIFQTSNIKCPDSASIVCFPLLPKPHDIIDEPWIIENWLSK